jgi:hypothetical protein
MLPGLGKDGKNEENEIARRRRTCSFWRETFARRRTVFVFVRFFARPAANTVCSFLPFVRRSVRFVFAELREKRTPAGNGIPLQRGHGNKNGKEA